MKLKFNGFLVLLVVLVAQITFAQERVVSGIVSDNAGMPLPGVSVLVKGTKSGTQTDFDGKYSIKASSNQILIFSFIGMKTQEVAASSTNLNVKMQDDTTLLNEIILPEDIANACFAYVGGLLNKTTGNVINVDGGIAVSFVR